MKTYPHAKWFSSRAAGWKSGPFFLAILVQGLLVAGAGLVVVMTPSAESEPEFEAAAAVHLPQRERQHRVAVSEFQRAAGAPRMMERLTTAALAPDGLPEMPSAFAELDTAADAGLEAMDSQSLLGDSGIAGILGGLGGAGETASFFGIEAAGNRIVIVVNTSASVINRARNRGVTVERIQQEIISMVEGLSPGARFGIVQFSQGARTFADHLAPATVANVDRLRQWVPENLRGNPRAATGQERLGHEAGLAEAFAFDPDVIFLVTDGQLNRREGSPGDYTYPEIPYSRLRATLDELRRETSSDVRLHVIGFEMRAADAGNMRRLASDFGGSLREF